MNEHDDDLEPEVDEVSALEVETYPDDEDLEAAGGDALVGDGEADDVEDDESEL